MSDLSEHDRAELDRIELELSVEDPRLARLLGGFGRRRGRTRGLRRFGVGRWLYVGVCAVVGLALVLVLIAFVH
ncbi:MAG TPA: DUF3040 domain-containing protein [Actinospica sp.]|jgi:hypothetical protein|nr:DUF3040 domain-containing protein [Actinospica sp.]